MSTWDPPTGPISVQRGGGRAAWVVALVAVAALLTVIAFWLRAEASDRAEEADRLNQQVATVNGEAKQLVENVETGNEALSDPELTREVTAYLTTAVEATFSYNHTDLAVTEQAVEEHLTGNARCTYDAMFAEVKRYAPEQKIVLSTRVRDLALISLDDNRAAALIYIDQLSTRADVNKTIGVGGQFAVQAQRQGDRWKITEFDMFSQPLVNGEPAPNC